MPENIYGIVLKRKFPKEENENYYFHFIYSVWLYCQSKEITEGIQKQINIPFHPLMIDWEGKAINITNDTYIKITSTPILLLGNIDNEIDEKPDENEEHNNDKDSKENSNDSNEFRLFIIFGSLFLLIIIIIIIIPIILISKKVKKKQNISNNNIIIEFSEDINGGLLIIAAD